MEVAAADDATAFAIQELLAHLAQVFRAQGEAAGEELLGVVRSEAEDAGDSGAFVVADEGEQDLAAGGVGHGPAGGFDGVGDATGGAVFDDVPARLVVPTLNWRLAPSVEQSSVESTPRTHRPSIAA